MGLYSRHSSNPNKRGCFIYAVILFVLLPILLCGGTALIFVGRERAAKQQLNAEKTRLQRLGLPVDDVTMQDYHESLTSNEDTAAWVKLIEKVASNEFQTSFAGVPILSPNTGKIPERWSLQEPTEWPEEADTRKFLKLWASLIDELESLAIKQNAPGASPVRMPIHFDSFRTLLPQTQEMRQLARLLAVRGELALYDRDSSQIRRSVESLFGCAKALDGEPILVSQLVNIAINGIGLDLLKQAIEYDALTEEDLSALLKLVLNGTRIDANWKRVWQGERAMALPVFDSPDLIGQNTSGAINIPMRSRDALNYLETIEGILEISTDNLDTLSAGLREEEAKLQTRMSGGYLERFDNVVTSLISPAITGAGNAFVRNVLSHRLAALAIAVRLYEKREGHWPKSLDDLARYSFDDVVLDLNLLKPTGKLPFGYRQDAQAAVVWGFDPQTQTSTPPDPELMLRAATFPEQIETWIWRIPGSAQREETQPKSVEK